MSTQDDLVDGLFQQAAAGREAPSATLMARILADAEANQPRPVPASVPRVVRPAVAQPGWFVTLADWFGGGLSLAGMTAAAGAGLYLGVAQPVALQGLAATVTGSAIERVELMPDMTSLWAME